MVDSVIDVVKTTPLTAAEVQRVKNYATVSTITGFQFRLARAERLAFGEVFDRDPLSYRTALQRQQAVTPAEVQRVARRYLGAGRVVLSMVPAGKLDQVSKPNLPFTNVTPPATAAPPAAPATTARGTN